MEATSTRRRICARHARSIPHVFSPREIRVKALRGQRSWFRIFQGALFLTRAAAHVPPFAFVLLQKTADSRERNRRKEKACLPPDPATFSPAKTTPTTRPPCPVVMLFAFAGFQMRDPRTAVFLRVCEEQKQTAGHERRTSKKNVYEKSSSS